MGIVSLDYSINVIGLYLDAIHMKYQYHLRVSMCGVCFDDYVCSVLICMQEWKGGGNYMNADFLGWGYKKGMVGSRVGGVGHTGAWEHKMCDNTFVLGSDKISIIGMWQYI